jgi:erythromycin esterase-like protein
MLATTAAGREAQRGTMLSSQQQQEKWMAKIEKTQKSQAKERAELEDDERDGRLFIQDLARLVLHASPRQ